MSASNVEVIRRLFEAFNARDLETMLEYLEPDAELHPLRAQLEGKAYRGHDGLREMLADFDEDWEFVQVDPDELRDKDDAVVVLGRLRARGRASGAELDVPMAFLWRLRGGKAAYAETFSEPQDALRAAGLE
jgi:ketosteroid isomerase-like protein